MTGSVGSPGDTVFNASLIRRSGADATVLKSLFRCYLMKELPKTWVISTMFESRLPGAVGQGASTAIRQLLASDYATNLQGRKLSLMVARSTATGNELKQSFRNAWLAELVISKPKLRITDVSGS